MNPKNQLIKMTTKNDCKVGIKVISEEKPFDPTKNNKFEISYKVHPFMAEGMQQLRRRSSSVQTRRNIMLTTSFNQGTEKEEGVSPMNFDENYLMFGGDKYKKVGKEE